MAIMEVIEEYVETNEGSDLSEGDLIVLVVKEIKEYFEENSSTDKRSVGNVVVEVVKTIDQNYALETFAYSVGTVMVKTIETINVEVSKASDMSEIDVAGAMLNVVTKINEIYQESSSSSKVEVANLIVSVMEVIVEDLDKSKVNLSELLLTVATDTGEAFEDVDQENVGALIYLTLNTMNEVLKSSDVSALIKEGDLMLKVATVIKDDSSAGLQSSSDVDTLLINVLTAINDNLGKDKRISRSLMLFSVTVTIEKVASSYLTQTEQSGSTQLISQVFQAIHKMVMSTAISSAVDLGELMVEVATKIKESHESMITSSSDIDLMAIAVMESLDEFLAEEKKTSIANIMSSVVTSIHEGTMSSSIVDSKSTLLISRILSTLTSIVQLSKVSSDVKVGMLFISVAKKVNEMFAAGMSSSSDVDTLIISVMETINMELGSDSSISRVTLLSATANKIYASTSTLVEDEMSVSTLVIIRTLSEAAVEIIKSKADAMVDTGKVLVEAAKKIQEAYSSGSTVESSTLIVTVIETVNTEFGMDESVDRGNVIVKIAETITDNVEMADEKDKELTTIIQMILSTINQAKKSSATNAETGNVMVSVAKKFQESYSSDTVYTSFVLMILEILEMELLDSKGDKGSLAFDIIEEVSKVITSSSTSGSNTIVKVTLSVLKSISREFKKTIKTDVDVITVMKGAVTKIMEVYDAGDGEEKTAITIVSSVIESIESEMGEDDEISRANIYALIAETVKVIFASSTSSSTVKWLEMYSSSATCVGKEFSKVSSSSKKEAGAMIAKFVEVINTEYGSTTNFTTYDSGKLISSIIEESVTLLSDSSLSSSSSFNSGLLIVNVATEISEAYTRATSYSDSGRLTTVSITSINTDITKSESSSSSSERVDQSELFSTVAEAVLEKYSMASDNNSAVTAGAVMVRVVKAVNEQLGDDVEKGTETVKLYVNVLKAISEEFQDIETFSDNGKKEAKAMIAAVEVLEGTLPDTIDTGDIILQIITDIHLLYDPNDTRVEGPQQFIDGILQTIADFFHGTSRKKGKLRKIQKNVSKVLRRVLFT